MPDTKAAIREQLLEVITVLTKVYADEDNVAGLPDWSDASDEEVARFIDAFKQIDADFNKSARGKLEQVMAQKEASELPCGEFIATMVETPEYDPLTLTMLFEHGLKEELFAKGAVVEVPATFKWSATKVKPFAKRGVAEAKIIAKARSVKYRTLKVTLKE